MDLSVLQSIFNLPKNRRIALGIFELIIATIVIFGLETLGASLRPLSWVVIFTFLLTVPLLLEKKAGLIFGFTLGAIRYITKQSPPRLDIVLTDLWSQESIVYFIIAFFFIVTIGLGGYALGTLREIIIKKNLLIIQLGDEHHKVDIILSAISEPLFIVRDRDFVILYSNSPFKELVGENVDGEKCYEVLFDRKSQCEFCSKQKVHDFDSKEEHVTCCEAYSPPLQRDFLVFQSPINWEKNEPAKLHIIIDITKRKDLEKEILALTKKRESFVNITAHELRTPLTIFRFSLEFLVNNWNQLTQKEITSNLQILTKNSTRLENLVENVNILMEISDEELHLQLEDLNLRDFLEEVVDQYKDITDLQITVSISDKDLAIRGDRKYFQKALVNILDNAIKHSPQNKKIELLVESKASSNIIIIIKITDFGAGISKEILNQLFQPYVSFDSEYSTGGTGLGLFVSKQIFQAHQWGLSVQSEGKGKGTSYFIEIKNRQS